MNSLVKTLPNIKKFNEYIFDVKKQVNPIMLSGLTDMGKVHLSYATSFYTERPICIITYNELQAKKLIKDLSYFSKEIEFFPKREIVSYDYIAESKDLLYQRISCLNNIINHKARIVVTTIEAVNQKIISKEALYKNVLKLKVGETIELEKMKETHENFENGHKSVTEFEDGRVSTTINTHSEGRDKNETITYEEEFLKPV